MGKVEKVRKVGKIEIYFLPSLISPIPTIPTNCCMTTPVPRGVGSTNLHNCICEVHCQTLQILYKKDCSFTKQWHTLLIKSPV